MSSVALRDGGVYKTSIDCEFGLSHGTQLRGETQAARFVLRFPSSTMGVVWTTHVSLLPLSIGSSHLVLRVDDELLHGPLQLGYDGPSQQCLPVRLREHRFP